MGGGGRRGNLPPSAIGELMKTEIWKDMPGYEGEYQASNMGRILVIPMYLQLLKERGVIGG